MMKIPHWAKEPKVKEGDNPVLTNKGWESEKTGEILVSHPGLKDVIFQICVVGLRQNIFEQCGEGDFGETETSDVDRELNELLKDENDSEDTVNEQSGSDANDDNGSNDESDTTINNDDDDQDTNEPAQDTVENGIDVESELQALKELTMKDELLDRANKLNIEIDPEKCKIPSQIKKQIREALENLE